MTIRHDHAPGLDTSGSNPHLDTALLAYELGLSPVPPVEDGSKAPLADVVIDGERTWKPYQDTPATEKHIRRWYANGRTGDGLAGGYGGLDPFEFDDVQAYVQFIQAARACGLGELVARIMAGYEEETPGGGVHWLLICPEPGPSTKLARRYKRPDEFNDKDREAIAAAAARGRDHKPIKTLIETKGRAASSSSHRPTARCIPRAAPTC